MTNTIEKKILEGERALYGIKDTIVLDCVFRNGESPLKETRNIIVDSSTFEWKYPLWYSKNIIVKNCTFEVMSRSGIWYTKDITINKCNLIAPKLFRKCDDVEITNTNFNDAAETLYWSRNIKLKNVKAFNGDYFMQGSENIDVDNLYLEGNYAFDGCKNVLISNSVLHSKDSFWNTTNVTLVNCTIIGEYLAWNSKNITFIDCKIESLQGLCYIQGLKMKNCSFFNISNLMFELCSDIDAEITSRVQSIKNPISGKIITKGYDECILDEKIIDPSKTEIIIR